MYFTDTEKIKLKLKETEDLKTTQRNYIFIYDFYMILSIIYMIVFFRHTVY